MNMLEISSTWIKFKYYYNGGEAHNDLLRLLEHGRNKVFLRN